MVMNLGNSDVAVTATEIILAAAKSANNYLYLICCIMGMYSKTMLSNGAGRAYPASVRTERLVGIEQQAAFP